MATDVGGVKGSIELSTKQAEKNVDSLKRKLADLEGMAEAMSKATDRPKKNMYQALASDAYKLTKQIKELKSTIATCNTELTKTSNPADIQKETALITELEAKLKDLMNTRRLTNKAAKEVKASDNENRYYGQLAAEINKTKKELTSLASKSKEVKKELEKPAKSNIAAAVEKDAAKAKVSTADLKTSILGIKAQLDGLDKVYSFGAEEALSRVDKESWKAKIAVEKLEKQLAMLQKRKLTDINAKVDTNTTNRVSEQIAAKEREIKTKRQLIDMYARERQAILETKGATRSAVAEQIIASAELLDAKQKELLSLKGIEAETNKSTQAGIKQDAARADAAEKNATRQSKASKEHAKNVQKEIAATKDAEEASKAAAKAASDVSTGASNSSIAASKEQVRLAGQKTEQTNAENSALKTQNSLQASILANEETRARMARNIVRIQEEMRRIEMAQTGRATTPISSELPKVEQQLEESKIKAGEFSEFIKQLPINFEAITRSITAETVQMRNLLGVLKEINAVQNENAYITNKKGQDVSLSQGTVGAARNKASVKELKREYSMLQAQIEAVNAMSAEGVAPVNKRALADMQAAEAELNKLKAGMAEVKALMNALFTGNTVGSDGKARASEQNKEYEAAKRTYAELFRQYQLLQQMYAYKREIWGTTVGYQGSEAADLQGVAAALQQQADARQRQITTQERQNAQLMRRITLESQIKSVINQQLAPMKRVLASLKEENKEVTTMRSALAKAKDSFVSLGQQVNKLRQTSKETSRNFKEISRVVSGILISQGFYRSLNAIRQMISDIKEAHMLTEDLSVAFGTMFHNMDMGKSLTNELQNFAAATPYTYEQVAKNARMLTAYGFQAKELLPVMQQLADASAAMGDDSQFERVVRALGQIRSKGKLMQEEVRQLTEAGINASDILREKLGLSSKQMQNLGKQAIPAEQAIAALLEGIQDRYAGASKELSKNTRGLLNTIKDNFLIIGREASTNLFAGFKEKLTKIGYTMMKMAKEMMKTGLGGWLEKSFSSEFVVTLRNFAANMTMFAKSIGFAFKSIGPLVRDTGMLIMRVANVILPVINAITNVITGLITHINNAHPWVRKLFIAIGSLMVGFIAAAAIRTLCKWLGKLFIVKGIAAGVQFLTSTVYGVAKAFIRASLSTKIWYVALLGIIGVIAVLLGKSGMLSKGINAISEKINGLLDNDVNKYLQPKKDTMNSWDDFVEKSQIGADNVEELGDNAEKAAKKAKNALASFDEIFSLTEDSTKDEAVGPDLSGFDDINAALAGIKPITGDDLFDMDDINTTLPSIVDKIGGFFDNIDWKKVLFGGGIGALIGGMIGSVFGPEGALKGALIGGGMGALAGALWNSFSEEVKRAFSYGSVGALLGGVIGTAIAPGAGTALGALLGGGAGALVGYFKDQLKEKFDMSDADFTNIFVGGLGGAVIGALMGGPLGAIIGLGIGVLLGDLAEDLIDGIEWLKTKLGEGWDAVKEWCAGTWNDLSEWCGNTYDDFATWCSNTYDDIATWCSDTWNNFSTWCSDTYNDFVTWSSDTWNSISTWCSNTWNDFSTWCSNTWSDISTWCDNTWNDISTWCSNTWNDFSTWCGNTWSDISTWCGNTWNDIKSWSGNTWSTIKDWTGKTWSDIRSWSSGTWSDFKDWCSNTWNSLTTWDGDTWEIFSSWFSNTLGGFGDFFSSLWDSFTTWLGKLKDKFIQWVKDLLGPIGWLIDKMGSLFETQGNPKYEVSLGDMPNSNPTMRMAAYSMPVSANVDDANAAIAGVSARLRSAMNFSSFSLDVPNPKSIVSQSVRADNLMARETANNVTVDTTGLVEAVVNKIVDNLPTPVYAGAVIADKRTLSDFQEKIKIIEVGKGGRRIG